MKTILSMLMSDDGKNLSSMRFVMVFIAVLSTVIVFGAWGYLCIVTRELVDIPQGVWLLYSGANALALGAKVTQSSIAETKPAVTSPQPEPVKP